MLFSQFSERCTHRTAARDVVQYCQDGPVRGTSKRAMIGLFYINDMCTPREGRRRLLGGANAHQQTRGSARVRHYGHSPICWLHS
jgi:hypothetical protein